VTTNDEMHEKIRDGLAEAGIKAEWVRYPRKGWKITAPGAETEFVPDKSMFAYTLGLMHAMVGWTEVARENGWIPPKEGPPPEAET
jgi:hypothetical protein